MSGAPIPVTVIAGYLGAGKTTLVNHLLRNAEGRRLVVLVNDFGEVAIDTDLIIARDGDKLTLANGCMCCAIGGDVLGAFDCALTREPRPDAILIEASGVAEPERIADYARAEPDLALDSIVVLAAADAVDRLLRDVFVGETVRRQIAAADLLILNRSDLVDASTRRDIAERLRAITPRAALVETVRAHVPADVVFDASSLASAFSCTEIDRAAPGDHERIFERWSFDAGPAPSTARLHAALAGMPAGIHRLKGFVGFADGAAPVVVQCVGGRIEITPAQGAMADPDRTLLVAVWPRGGVDRAALEECLRVGLGGAQLAASPISA
jgi:G3E family GTPase